MIKKSKTWAHEFVVKRSKFRDPNVIFYALALAAEVSSREPNWGGRRSLDELVAVDGSTMQR